MPQHLKVVVAYNCSNTLVKGEARDILAERGVLTCAKAVAEALETAGHHTAPVPICRSVEEELAPYPPREWVVFNLVEGFEGRLFEEARCAWALEAMGYRFTGSGGDALARSIHKARAKSQLDSAGVPTPAWRVFRHEDDVKLDRDRRNGSLRFPLIVKPVAEDGSLGVGAESVVHTIEALRGRVAYVTRHYGQMALVEQFLTGREINVSLWGNPVQVLPLGEIDYGAFDDPYRCIVSYDAKWQEDSFEFRHTPVTCPANVEPGLARNITCAAREAWHIMGCTGYARVDMRVDAAGCPHVLEVNCNPDLSPDAGFHRSAQAGGHSYKSMIIRILETAVGSP
jgi:D-alanine-D-alanine ligase